MYIQDKTIISDPNLKTSEIALLFILRYHIRYDDESYVSQNTLVRESKLCRQTVMSVVDSLENKGWLEITRRPNTTHIYRFKADKYTENSKNYTAINCNNTSNSESANVKSLDSMSNKMTTSVKNNDSSLQDNLTTGCKINLHKEYKPKTTNQKTKQENTSVDESTQSETHKSLSVSIGEKLNTKPSFNVNAFEIMWKTEILNKYTDIKYVNPFTSKEKGIIKYLSEKTQPYELISVVRTIISKWNEFIIYTEKNTSAFKSPFRPDLPYLTKYIESAVNFYLTKCDSKSTSNVDIDSFATNKPDKISDKDIKYQEMLNAWREIMSTNYDFNPDAVVFSSDETHRVNEFIGKFKKNNPVDVLKACLLNWGKFRTLLQEQLDVKGLPIFPSVQLICTHHTVAYHFYKETVMQPLNS